MNSTLQNARKLTRSYWYRRIQGAVSWVFWIVAIAAVVIVATQPN
jgi:hypothetical protein